MSEPDHPNLDKLRLVAPYSQKIGEFLDWLRDEKGVVLARRHRHDDGCASQRAARLYGCGISDGELLLANENVTRLLGEFFGIDLDAVEKERRAILKYLRERAG